MLLSVLWQIIAPVFIVVALGYVFARWRGVELRPISQITLYVLSPCLVFSSLSTAELSVDDMGRIVLFALLGLLGMMALSWPVQKGLHLSAQDRSGFLLATLFTNSGNFGIPLNLFAFGEAGKQIAVIYFAMSALLTTSVGVYIASSGRVGFRRALFEVMSVPIVYAAVLGLGMNLMASSLPEPVMKAIRLTGDAAVPLMLLVLGMQLARTSLASAGAAVGAASFLRLMAGPAIGVLVASLLGMEGMARQVAIVQISMPTAVMTTILANEYDSAPDLVAGTVFTDTLLSAASLSLLLAWLMR